MVDLAVFMKAVAAVHAHAKAKGLGRGNGGTGKVKCPLCQGKLKYSVASVTGHLWGACTTEGCIRWME